jgi:hypothetical protein
MQRMPTGVLLLGGLPESGLEWGGIQRVGIDAQGVLQEDDVSSEQFSFSHNGRVLIEL